MSAAIASNEKTRGRVGRLVTRRRIRLGILLTLILVLVWLGSSFIVAFQLTHRNGAPFTEDPPNLSWGVIEPLRLITRDQQQLGAWFIEGDEDAPSVLLLHGKGGCRGSCLPLAEMLSAQHVSQLLVTLRAHGDSSGNFCDLGFGSRLDVIAAVEWLEQRRPGKPIVILGQSMGAAAAIFAGHSLRFRVTGYVLDCPYKDLATALRNRTRHYLPPLIEGVAYLGLRAVTPVVLPDCDHIAPINVIGRLPRNTPVLFLAGGKDTRTRLEDIEALYERSPANCRMVVFPDADHLGLLESDPKLYQQSVFEFLRDARNRPRRWQRRGAPNQPLEITQVPSQSDRSILQ